MFTSKFSGLHIEHGKNLLDSELLEFSRKLSSVQGNLEDQILHWDFGAIMNMKFDPETSNYLFSREAVPLHWDGAFYLEPRKLLFYCTESAGEGGETIFLNTELLWESLSEVEKEELRKITLTYSTEKKAHYGGIINIPIVQKHPETHKTILRMAEKVETTLNPVNMVISGSDDPTDFYVRMVARLNNPNFQYVHRWSTGDLIVCDNFTYLHGRKTLNNNMNRSFKRIQIL